MRMSSVPFTIACLVLAACGSPTAPVTVPSGQSEPEPVGDAPTGTRDPYRQPFASDSIWNHPIGGGARYVPARISAPRQFAVYAEEEIIILAPDAPPTPVYENHADWVRGADRSSIDGPVLAILPIPGDFTTDPILGDTPNHAAAILMADGRTLHNSQPFTRVRGADYATSHYVYPESDLYGDGIRGAHGGSGLSGLGGTIRLGELVPGGRIPHALKLVFDSRWYAYRADDTPGYRWPASHADNHASRFTYRGAVPALEMGALLALLPDFPVSELETGPGRIVATALRDYGAYVCDSAGWDSFYLSVERSPEGRVLDEFREAWGHDFVMKELDHPWTRDTARMIEALQVVDNNGPESVGGGGEPRCPPAPPLLPPTGRR